MHRHTTVVRVPGRPRRPRGPLRWRWRGPRRGRAATPPGRPGGTTPRASCRTRWPPAAVRAGRRLPPGGQVRRSQAGIRHLPRDRVHPPPCLGREAGDAPRGRQPAGAGQHTGAVVEGGEPVGTVVVRARGRLRTELRVRLCPRSPRTSPRRRGGGSARPCRPGLRGVRRAWPAGPAVGGRPTPRGPAPDRSGRHRSAGRPPCGCREKRSSRPVVRSSAPARCRRSPPGAGRAPCGPPGRERPRRARRTTAAGATGTAGLRPGTAPLRPRSAAGRGRGEGSDKLRGRTVVQSNAPGR